MFLQDKTTDLRDHPRMHGEHRGDLFDVVQAQGSSPYARGAQPDARAPSSARGIIPVCTGSTECALRGAHHRRDHPRMHGEHGARKPVSLPLWGSSPYARGAPQVSISPEEDAGIIPVCTGSTAGHRSWKAVPRDHPRMHGEHLASGDEAGRTHGSSPYARGAQPTEVLIFYGLGIIPVCTGSTPLPR